MLKIKVKSLAQNHECKIINFPSIFFFLYNVFFFLYMCKQTLYKSPYCTCTTRPLQAENDTSPTASAKKSSVTQLSRKMSQRSVTFAPKGEGLLTPEMVDMGVQTLPPEQEEVIASIRAMLGNEPNMEDPQQKLLDAVRAAILTQDENVQTDDNIEEALVNELKTRTMTIFTLASHISNESVLLGVEPSSVFKTFASLHHSKTLTEDDEKRSMTFALPHTPKLTDEMLRRLTKSDLSNKEEVCV